MPEPSNNKPKPKVRRGPQLKPLPKVVVEAVAQEKVPVVSDAGLSVKPSDEPVVGSDSKEEDTVIVPIFGVAPKAKKKEKEAAAPAPTTKPKEEEAKAKPKYALKRVDVPKPVAEAPPAGPKKPVLLPEPEADVAPAEEEAAPAPKPTVEDAAPAAKPTGEEAAPGPKPTEEETGAPKKRVFKVRAAAVAPGPKETLDGFSLTADEQDFLSKLTEPELKDLAKAIMTIEKQNPYATPVPSDGFVPENRRAFSNFINTTFSEFKLSLPKLDPAACDKLTGTQTATMYKYQEFVRDYMRWQSPYRGLLIYHGLGSGKTCSAIAAAEALFSQGNRRIIVLTPASLQENFLKEISFCGFEHFRLNNNWIGIPKNPGTQPLILLFAEKVLRIPKEYLNRPDVDTIWIPDFRKRTAESTIRSSRAFKDLNEKEKQQVREQIENIVFRVDSRDPKKRRYGRIQFISYNGVGKEQLRQIAAQAESEGGFDNAVIIIDEVHNLVRNMQGQIDPFLIDLPGKRKKITFDPITHERWVPKQSVSYPRGILFYRLLVGAKNSKVIGLSGTPIINFPEEIGILMNILHGYNHIGTAMIPKKSGDTQQTLLKLKTEFTKATKEFEFTDFFEAIVDTEKGVKVTVTMLPEGIRKLAGKEGVERMPMGQDSVSFADRFQRFEAFLRSKGVFTDANKFTIQSEPLLPPTRDAFNDVFANPANDFILMKRMSGLVSYYKGSRKDLMPEKTEVLVQCPMSLVAQKYYLQLRAAEMKLEEAAKKKKQKAKGTATLSKFWAMAYDIENLDVANSYRVATRQACNFAFPKEVRRPRPQEKEELQEETGLDRDPYLDDLGAETKPGDVEDEDADELSNTQAQEVEQEAVADAEDQATLLEDLQSQLDALKQMAADGEIDEEDLRAQIEEITNQFQQAMMERALYVAEEGENELVVAEAAKTADEKYCTAIKIRPTETYKERIARAMKCLRDVTGDKLVYGSTLPVLSTKYEYMIENILKTKDEKHGSNLVYSNYLSMEGLGIFTMILDMMGWKKIVIEESGTDLKFSKETLESLAEGPSSETPRYIYFTGGEKNKVRKAAINVFNFNLKDLPPSLTKALEDNGFTDNKQGTLCNLFCITSAGAEGLSLHNVRAVHIMEPHWNDVRMAQVKGRAIRICSHKALELDQRNVTVYTYLATFSDLTQVLSSNDPIKDPKLVAEKEKEQSSLAEWTLPYEMISAESERISVEEAKALGLQFSEDIQSTYYITTDVALANLGALKKKTSERIQKLMKTGAVDCDLNFNENQDGTFACIKFEEKLGEGGDFLYHPNLKEDATRWSKQQFAKVDLQAIQAKKETYQKIVIGKANPKEYILKPVVDTTGKISHYEIYPSGTTEFTEDVKWGTVNANADGKAIRAAAAFHPKKK
jgi:hypothetical protein